MVTKSENTGQALRRSTRVSIELGVHVRSLDPAFHFEEDCRTLLVNAQGCGFQCSRQLPVGIAVLFTIDGRQATATILNATFLGESSGAWVIGARLHHGGNFWGLPSPPADWAQVAAQPEAPPAVSDALLSAKVTAAVERQTEQLVATVCAQVEELVASREADFLARMVEETAVAKADIARQAADQASARMKAAFDELSRHLRHELEEQVERQRALIEERIEELQRRTATAVDPSKESKPSDLPAPAVGTHPS